MKKILLICLLIIPLIGRAQILFPVDSLTHKPAYVSVIPVKMHKDTLYSRALEFLALNITSIKHAIELQDKEDGKITGHFTITTNRGDISESFFLFFKDNKYKYIITDFHFIGNGIKNVGSWDITNDKPSMWVMGAGAVQDTKKAAANGAQQFIDGLYKAETSSSASDF